MKVAAVDLQVGDRVMAHEDNLDYVVVSVDAQQGRVQVSGETGGVHTYSQSKTVDITRTASGQQNPG
jgi:hypothetical protein